MKFDGMTTGEKQRALAAIVAEYAAVLSHGELRAAIRLGAPTALEGICNLCGSPMRVYCDTCEGKKGDTVR